MPGEEGLENSRPECSSITAIEPQVRYRDRYNIYVDGEWAAGVHAEVVAVAGLRVGQPVTLTELQALLRAEELRRVRDSALQFLGYRARSRVELRRRLLQKGYDVELVEETLALLDRNGLVNDAEFSQSWVRARTGSKPMGPNRIAAELRQKGVDREVIDEALEAVDRDVEMDLALAVGRRKIEQLRDEDPRTARRKLGAVLMRRGFTSEVCVRVLDILLRSDEEL
jgi:regulatory protein